jgi:phosphopantothenoylcysteine synthetase/decarboxylase
MSVYSDETDKVEFISELATGKVDVILQQEEMARAVEFWLNERVVRVPCRVETMHSAVVNNRATFTIRLKEVGEGKDG